MAEKKNNEMASEMVCTRLHVQENRWTLGLGEKEAAPYTRQNTSGEVER